MTPFDWIFGATIGQESGGNPNAATSITGARGIGQIRPQTFAQYAQPGENINNPNDNLAVSRRIQLDYYNRYNGDPARMAVAYFSGPHNVAPPGSPTPWIKDKADPTGKTVSSYVNDIQGRIARMAYVSDNTAKSLGLTLAPVQQQGAAPTTAHDDIAGSLGLKLAPLTAPPPQVVTQPDIIPGSAAAGVPTRITVRPRPPAPIEYQSGLQNQLAEGMPIVGPLFNKAVAAAGAGIQPLVSDTGQSTFAERYAQNLNALASENRQFAAENPVAATGANVLGGTLATVPFGATELGGRALGLVGSSIGSRLYQSALGGAVVNSIDAALRGDNPLQAGEIGGIMGPAATIVGEGVRSGVGSIASRYFPQAGPLQDVNPVARDFLARSLEGETPQSIAAAQQRMGPRGFFGDIGTGTTDLTGGLADIPGPQKAAILEAYRQRAATQGDAIEGAVRQAMGPRTDLLQYQQFLTEARKAAADPLYQQWRDTQVHPTDKLKGLIPRLESAGAFDQAERLSSISGEPINKAFFTTGAQKEFPTTQSWDYVKRGLDSKIDQAYSSGDKTLARSLVQLRNELVGEIENTNAGQVWKAARQEFASRSELLDQIAAGQDTFIGGRSGVRPDELREELKGLGGPELAARILGARDAITQAMGAARNGDTTLRNKLLAPNNIEKLQLLLGKNRADPLIDALKQEEYLSNQAKNIIGGSPTAPKGERIKTLAPPQAAPWSPKLTEPLSFIPPSWIDALRPSTILEGARAHSYGQAYNQLAPILLTQQGPQMNALVSAIHNEVLRRTAAQGAASRIGSVLTGAMTGPGVTTARRRLNFQTANPLAVSSAR